jgi:hypothetical protein
MHRNISLGGNAPKDSYNENSEPSDQFRFLFAKKKNNYRVDQVINIPESYHHQFWQEIIHNPTSTAILLSDLVETLGAL